MKRLLLLLSWLLLSLVARAQYSGTGTVSLTAPVGASGVQWYTLSSGAPVAISGQTSPTYAAGTSGIYLATYQLAGQGDCTDYTIVISQGSSVTLNGSTNNTGGSNYQWYQEDVAVSGATTANYAATTGGRYRFEFDNGGSCAIKSDDYTVYTLTPCATPSVGGAAAFAGGPLCATANTGTVTLSGQTGAVVTWQTSTNGGTTWSDLAGTSGRSYYGFVTAANGQQYRAVVNGGSGCASENSTPVTITTSAGACTAPGTPIAGPVPPALPTTCDYPSAPANIVLTGTTTATYLLVDMASGVIAGVNTSTPSFSNVAAGVYYAVAAQTSATLVNATVGKLVSDVGDAVSGCVVWSPTVALKVCTTTCDATSAPASLSFTASTAPAGLTTTYVLVDLAINTIAALSNTPSFGGIATGDYEALAIHTPTATTLTVGSSLYTYLTGSGLTNCGGTGSVVSNALFFKVCSSPPPALPPTVAINTPNNVIIPVAATATSANPPISGTATALASVTVNAPGGQVCLTAADASGNWTCSSLTFAIGSQTVTATASNTAGVSSPATASFTVVQTPVACANPSVGGTVAFAGTLPLCNAGNAGTLTLSGQTGAVIKWQTSTDGGSTFTDIANTSTSLAFTNAANNQQYRAMVHSGGSCSPAFSSPVTITTSAAACSVACAVLPDTIAK
ncbi:hypothetical protein [Fibrella arboris]|uniref:hypothetical protein n=1 Tax=Fibrella arboris TaxID=3242486 RepID=UPI0035216FCF